MLQIKDIRSAYFSLTLLTLLTKHGRLWITPLSVCFAAPPLGGYAPAGSFGPLGLARTFGAPTRQPPGLCPQRLWRFTRAARYSWRPCRWALGIRYAVAALRAVQRFPMPPKSSLAVEGFLQAFVGLFSIIRLVYSLLVVFLRLRCQFAADWGGLMRLRAFKAAGLRGCAFWLGFLGGSPTPCAEQLPRRSVFLSLRGNG